MSAGYPIILDLSDWLCLVVGGGEVAERKVAGLLKAGAAVRVVSPTLVAPLAADAAAGRIEHRARFFTPSDLAGVQLVIAATDDREVNAAVAAEARARGALVNVADAPEEGNFWVPAVVRRGELTLTVSTGRASPALARRLRQQLEAEFGPEWGAYVGLLGALRPLVLARQPDSDRRQALFRDLAASSELPARLAEGDVAGVVAVLRGMGVPGTVDELSACVREALGA